MTHFLRDILRQPKELQRTIEFLLGSGAGALEAAKKAILRARHAYLTGIGSSWHAALTAGPLFYGAGFPVYMLDAADLLEFAAIPTGSTVVVISRSGRSIEIVNLLAKVRGRDVTVVGITNSADGPLAREAQISIVVPVELDHAISVNTYSTLALTAGILARAVASSFDASLTKSLVRVIERVESAFAAWQTQIETTSWLSPGSVYYFLARGSSMGSCQEARLLWEEGVKSPAAAMNTGSFRHGPQEMVNKGNRLGVWIDGDHSREQDLAVARDLRRLGATVMLIGQDLSADAGDLVLQLPPVPAAWQFLIDIIPAQLAAERLSRMSGVDCDSFRYCSFIVEDEYGLLHDDAKKPGA
ncbi:MAG: SIS domain-containing protein [Acidobacteriota bacterium]|nr:SIS domain-containing protein [Acidobacteriota bacterium]